MDPPNKTRPNKSQNFGEVVYKEPHPPTPWKKWFWCREASLREGAFFTEMSLEKNLGFAPVYETIFDYHRITS
jgi:hypothetical protein